MKETWETPRIAVEKFAPNEYVSSCLTVTLTCALPGSSKNQVGDGDSTVTDDNGMWHGLCGDPSVSFISDSGSGYETSNGKIDLNRKISNIRYGDIVTSNNYKPNMPTYGSTVRSTGTYFATWDSTDGAGIYHHYGSANVTYIDNSHPNHS